MLDDQQDYFSTDSSNWLTPEQKKQLEKLQQEREQKKKEKGKVKISFDFSGRRVVLNEGAYLKVVTIGL